MQINFYYYQGIKEGTVAIDFKSTDIWWKKYILELVVPFNTFKDKEEFLSNRYFYFENGEFRGFKIKSSRLKKMKIVEYNKLNDPNVPKPILNFI